MGGSSAKKKAIENEAFASGWSKILVPWNVVYLACALLQHFFLSEFTFWKAVGAAGLICAQAFSFFFILQV